MPILLYIYIYIIIGASFTVYKFVQTFVFKIFIINYLVCVELTFFVFSSMQLLVVKHLFVCV